MTVFDTLRVHAANDRVVVELHRPQQRNAINAVMVAELHRVCADLERDPRLLIITGAGSDFAAGADIAELRARRRDDALAGINRAVFDRIAALAMPTIAAVEGNALGGGAELAYACDLRIAGAGARFGNPEPGLGILAAAGASYRLADLVGRSIAKQVILGGRRSPPPTRWPTASGAAPGWRCGCRKPCSTRPHRTRCSMTSRRRCCSRVTTRPTG